uniref:Farnesyl-diphosphate farnesyltransferase n=1 Tax=Candidatus Kentrum sp. LFY TaxID=2126342 RepID=A0A450URV2_9GAMM|nr:MAG: farnesyl-diphosphate farnesyltransferase [Candidatus Kentron sp. LFY]
MPHWIAKDTADMTDEAYQAYSLQGVSRTFALTIPQLPERLRLQVGNAYLLCRTCDTIEDEPYLTIEQKQKFSNDFIHVVEGNASANTFADKLSSALTDATPEAERDLIRNAARVIRLTHSFTASQRRAIARCVEEMSIGMVHYQRQQSLNGLRDIAELGDYCYYVAGVVGIMLTELFSEYSRKMARNREEMLKLAVSFGQGLQMTNILKDIWDDRQRGACWLPRDVFSKCAFDLQEIPDHRNDSCYLAGMGNLIGVASNHLRRALQYTLLIPVEEKGIRRFCFWALGMALLTLRNIDKHRGFQSGGEVKISRRSLKAVIAATELVVGGNRRARWLFELLAKGLPDAPEDAI